MLRKARAYRLNTAKIQDIPKRQSSLHNVKQSWFSQKHAEATKH